ncbi:hypothetical protein DOTSEDRAFT_32676 [Dothistroma septosporum NZE10]|uniref:Uncharacterized protein n=1 Tax=Dothistroma septosporum (strain NZE10 / CBS 128990) TaxID=675120 RepID=N1PUD8_DOTSN|nr:hypothetical protein DOTSEDRAFT_32676 [Dothistroma septosporum NZE10]
MAPQRRRPNLHLDLSDLTRPQYSLQRVSQEHELPQYRADDRPRDELGQTYYDASAEISSLEVGSPDVGSTNRGSYYVGTHDRHVSWTVELPKTVVHQASPRTSNWIITKIMSPFRKGNEVVTPQSVAPSPVLPERRYFTLKRRSRART